MARVMAEHVQEGEGVTRLADVAREAVRLAVEPSVVLERLVAEWQDFNLIE